MAQGMVRRKIGFSLLGISTVGIGLYTTIVSPHRVTITQSFSPSCGMMNPRTRNITSGGQHQYLYDHSTPFGRFNAWLNRLPWNWILITCAAGFLVLLFYISIEPSIQLDDGPIAFALDSKDWANSSVLNNGTEYVFEGDGIHAVKFPGFDTSLNTSTVETVLLRNAHIDLPEFLNQIHQSGLERIESIYLENVSVSGTLTNQVMPKVRISVLI